ncbi:MAG: glycosyltransferase, partial [Planctomycetes bacterium]|nr:glycosyltransferase [Planctomycetota bacterium]
MAIRNHVGRRRCIRSALHIRDIAVESIRKGCRRTVGSASAGRRVAGRNAASAPRMRSRRSARRADRVICPSEATAEQLCRYYGVEREKVVVLP